ncbi:MAG: hypothetical protein ACKVJI_12355, partial [Pseudomonadales bacterium]
DISQYILYLYSGTGVPDDQEAPYLVDGLTFPFLYDASTGIIKDGANIVLTGSQASGEVLSPGGSAEFGGLPAGDYFAVAREQLSVAWQTGDTDRCWSSFSFNKQLVDLAYAPILSGTPIITSNTNCDVALADGGNGQLSISVAEDPAENLNDASDQQPPGYIFTWKNASNVVVKTASKTTENATSTTDANLVAGTYTVTIQRAHINATLSYTGLTGTFTAGEKLNLSGTGTGSGYIQSVGTGNMVIYKTNGTFGPGVTLTGVSSGATATQSGALVDEATLSANGCVLVETIILDDDPEQHVVSQATTVDYNNCDAVPASTITLSDNFILADGVAQPAADYTYEWFKSGSTAADKIAGQTAASIDLSNLGSASFVIADRYYVVATNTSNGCVTPAFEVNVLDNTSAPVISFTGTTADTSCDPTTNEGNGSATFAITGPQLNSNYTYQWYAGADASGVALTDGGTISGTSGGLNFAADGNYTATLAGVDGGSYTVLVTDTEIPNNTCSTTSTIFISEDITKPTLVASNYSLQDNQNCSTPNGFFEITTLSEGVSTTEAVNGYSFSWFESDGTTGITSGLSNVGIGINNRIDGLIGGTYKVEITNTTKQCIEVLEFIIEDQSVSPLINLVSSTDDAYCINGGFVGDGALTIEITDEGAAAALSDFSVEWYRGRLNERPKDKDYTDSIEFLYDDSGTVPATGTAFGVAYDYASTRGDAALGGDILTLTGLSAGDYTVFISKNNSASDASGQNFECETLVTYTVSKNSPYLSVNHPATPGAAGSYTVVDNTNCDPLSGSITLSEVLVNGAVVNLVNSSPYTISWVDAGSRNIAASNAGVSIANDQLTLLDAATYTYTIANNLTGCSTELISVDVERDVSYPVVTAVATSEDIVCEDGTYTPTGAVEANVIVGGVNQSVNDYIFTWYEDPALTILVSDAKIVGYNNGNAGANILKELANGNYYVVATDNTTPNQGCANSPAEEVTVVQFNPTMWIEDTEGVDYSLENVEDCNPLDGKITILKIYESRPLGASDVISTNMADYRFKWFVEDGTTALGDSYVFDADDVTAKNNDSDGASIVKNLPAGIYFLQITNTSTTGCSQAPDMVRFEIEEESRNPVSLTTTYASDISCQGNPVGIAYATALLDGVKMDSADYNFTWYIDALFTTQLTIATATFSGVGTNGSAGASWVYGLPEGTYFLKMEDLTSPGKGCTTTFIESVTIPSYQIMIYPGTTADVDFVLKHSDDCNPLNGSYEVKTINETRPVEEWDSLTVSNDITSTTMTDYQFDWFEYDGTTSLGSFTSTATFLNGSTPSSNGGVGASKVANLPAGIYYVKITNITTGCSQTAVDMSKIVILDNSEIPLINVVSMTNSNDCARPDFEGDGSLAISLPEDEANYNIEWFRGSTVGTVGDVNWLFGTSTVGSGANVGTAVKAVATSHLALNDLADGSYTASIIDNLTPGFGCASSITISILKNEITPILNIPESQIVDNTRCELPSNGSILINSGDITLTSGSSNVDDFDWVATYNNGTVTTPITVTISGTGAGSQIVMGSLSPGVYSFTATSIITKCFSAPLSIEILGRGVAPLIDYYTVTPDADCASNLKLGIIELESIDGIAPIASNYTLQWYVGSDTLGSTVDASYAGVDGTISVLSGVPEGNYTVKVINTDNGNCTSIRTVMIENEPLYPIIEDFYVSTSNICPEAGYAPGNGYFELASIWYDGVTITDSTTLANEYTLEYAMTDYDASSPLKIDSLAPNTYSVYIRRNDSDCRSEEVTTFTIGNTQVDPIIIFNQIEADSTCSTTGTLPNGVLVATADGSSGPGYSFQWSDVSSTPLGTNDTLSGLYAGTYQLVVTDSITKCSATNTYPVTNVPFEFEINDYSFTDPTVCDPTNGILEVTSVDRISTRVGASALTYQFYEGDPANGGVLVQDSNLNMFSAGVANTTYLFQATNPDYGCSSGLVQVFLSDSSLVFPVISLATSDFGLNSWNQFSCDPDGPTGRLSVAVDDINDNPDFTYEWVKIQTSGALVISTVLPITTAVADSLAAGTYRVTATNIITQCQSSEEYSLIDEIQNPLVVSTSASSNINCLNPNGQMGASVLDIGENRAYKSALDAYTYYWFEGLITEVSPDVSLAKYIGITIDSVAAGIYTVYAVDNTTDCFTSDPTVPSSVVEVEDESTLPDLSVDVVNDLTICDPTMADGFAEIIDSENELFKYTIAWYTGIDTTQSVPFQYGTFADSLLAGDYLTMITNNITGCVQFESFTILDLTERVPAPNAVVLSDRTHCEYANGHAAVSVLGETDFYEFNWYLEADPRTVAFTGTEIDLLDTATYRVVAQNLTTTCYSEPSQITINNGISDPAFRVEVKASVCDRTEDGSTNQFTGGASIVFEEYHTIDSISWINEQGIEINYGDPKAFVLGNAAPGKYTVYFKPENGCLYQANFIIDASITIYNGLSINDDGNNDFFLIDCADFF